MKFNYGYEFSCGDESAKTESDYLFCYFPEKKSLEFNLFGGWGRESMEVKCDAGDIWAAMKEMDPVRALAAIPYQPTYDENLVFNDQKIHVFEQEAVFALSWGDPPGDGDIYVPKEAFRHFMEVARWFLSLQTPQVADGALEDEPEPEQGSLFPVPRKNGVVPNDVSCFVTYTNAYMDKYMHTSAVVIPNTVVCSLNMYWRDILPPYSWHGMSIACAAQPLADALAHPDRISALASIPWTLEKSGVALRLGIAVQGEKVEMQCDPAPPDLEPLVISREALEFFLDRTRELLEWELPRPSEH